MLERMDIENLVLRPNCLLTKYPLVFLNGPGSLFYHKDLGLHLQDYIKAHGYRVFCPKLPYRNYQLRKTYLNHWLQQQEDKNFHFILGEETQREFQEVINQHPNSSFTLSTSFYEKPLQSTPIAYQLHQLLSRLYSMKPEKFSATFPEKNIQFYERFLDHCIELAENDLICET